MEHDEFKLSTPHVFNMNEVATDSQYLHEDAASIICRVFDDSSFPSDEPFSNSDHARKKADEEPL